MDLDQIKRLRENTSLGISECKRALDEAEGDFDKALRILKKRGVEITARKRDRRASQGLVESYVHFGGNLASIIEVNCETDFVARTDIFKKFAKDIAMHVAAASPLYISREQVPEEELNLQKNAEDYIKNSCLLEQMFIRDTSISVQEYLKQVVSQTGENIVIRRFCRYALGEE